MEDVIWELIKFNETDEERFDMWDFDTHAHYLLDQIKHEIDKIEFMKKTEEIRWNYTTSNIIDITEALRQLNKTYVNITGDGTVVGKIAQVFMLMEELDNDR